VIVCCNNIVPPAFVNPKLPLDNIVPPAYIVILTFTIPLPTDVNQLPFDVIVKLNNDGYVVFKELTST